MRTLQATSDSLVPHLVTHARGDASEGWLLQVMLKEVLQQQAEIGESPNKGILNPPQILSNLLKEVLSIGNGKSARRFSAQSFLHPLGVMDVRAFGSWMSTPICFFFQGFEGLPKVFDPGHPHE